MDRLSLYESLVVAYNVFKDCRRGEGKIYFLHGDAFGVPNVAVLMAIGREAWRISHLAIEAWPQVEKN